MPPVFGLVSYKDCFHFEYYSANGHKTSSEMKANWGHSLAGGLLACLHYILY